MMKAMIARRLQMLSLAWWGSLLAGCGTLSYDYIRDPAAEQPLGGQDGWMDESSPSSLIDVEFGGGVEEPRVTKNLPRDAVRAISRSEPASPTAEK